MSQEEKENPRCRHCNDNLLAKEIAHIDEHPGLCCECFDLSLGAGLEEVNDYRRGIGRPEILKPWEAAFRPEPQGPQDA